jgi:hypothetical protein
LTRLQKRALKALGYVVFAYLLFRLLPALKQALHSLEHVRWEWIVGAVAYLGFDALVLWTAFFAIHAIGALGGAIAAVLLYEA